MSPLSKTSISGLDPASFMACAMIVMFSGELITAEVPDHIVLRSSEQISGFRAWMCSTRRSGCMSVVPGAATFGSSLPGMKRWPGPVVRLIITSTPLSRMRSTVSR
jgi:hypothetical protein